MAGDTRDGVGGTGRRGVGAWLLEVMGGLAVVLVAGGCASSKTTKPEPEVEAAAPASARQGRVSLAETARVHGFKVEATGGGKYAATKGDGRIELQIESRVARFGTEIEILDIEPRLIDGQLWVSHGTANMVDDYLDAKVPPKVVPAAAPTTTVKPGKGLRGFRVIIDAGHGGKDPGTSAKSGLREKNVVLRVSLEVQRLLEAAGATVIMTRANDVFIELDDRPQISNKIKPDAFVSIHADSAPNKEAKGVEIFYAIKHRTSPGAAVLGRSKRLAETLLRRLEPVTPWPDRGIKPNTNALKVVKENDHPAVLVEIGFLTNVSEAKLLAQADYQKKIAAAIAQGIGDYAGR